MVCFDLSPASDIGAPTAWPAATALGRVRHRRDLRSRRALEARMSPGMFLRLVGAWTGALGALLVLALSIRWLA